METIIPTSKSDRHQITWDKYQADIEVLAQQIDFDMCKMREKFTGIYGIPRGGLVVAVSLSHILGLPLIRDIEKVTESVLIVDDLVDTGKQMLKYNELRHSIATLYRKDCTMVEPDYSVETINAHIIFPWETEVSTL